MKLSNLLMITGSSKNQFEEPRDELCINQIDMRKSLYLLQENSVPKHYDWKNGNVDNENVIIGD